MPCDYVGLVHDKIYFCGLQYVKPMGGGHSENAGLYLAITLS
jgi:hypothetical protein